MSSQLGSAHVSITGNTAGLQQALSEAQSETQSFAKSAGGMISGFASTASTAFLGLATGAIAAFTASLVAAGTRAFIFSGEFRDSMTHIQNVTGSTAAEMAGFRDSLENVYSSGLADSLGEAAEVMARVGSVINVTGAELEGLTAGALAMSKAFGTDLEMSVRATDQMITHLGVSGEEAMDLMTYAIQETGDQAGDLAETFNEYANQFAQMGLDAEDMTAALVGGLEGGVFDSDKVADSFKEMHLSFMEGGDEIEQSVNEVFAAAGDEGAQAWLDIKEKVDEASAEVEKHEKLVAESEVAWKDAKAKVDEYERQIQRTFQELKRLVNDEDIDFDTSNFDDQIDRLEDQRLQLELEKQRFLAAHSGALDETDKQYLDAISQQIKDVREEQDVVYTEMEITMRQQQKAAEEATRAFLEQQGYDIEDIYDRGFKSVDEFMNHVETVEGGLKDLHKGNNQAIREFQDIDRTLTFHKDNLEAAEEAERVWSNVLENAKNPAEVFLDQYQNASPEIRGQLIKDFGKSLVTGLESGALSDGQAQKVIATIMGGAGEDAGLGLVAAMDALNKGLPAGAADGALDEVEKNLEANRTVWDKFFTWLDLQLLPLGDKLQGAVKSIEPAIQNLMDYLTVALPPLIEKLGQAIDYIVALMTGGDTSGAPQWLVDLRGQIEPVLNFLMGIPGVLASINPYLLAIGAAITAFAPVLVGMWPILSGIFGFLTGGTVLATLGGIAATLAGLAAPITAVVVAMGVLYTAWTQNWGDIQGKTAEAMTYIQELIGMGLEQLNLWWQQHGQDVMLIINTAWETIMAVITFGMETLKALLESEFAGHIMNIIKLGVDNLVLIFSAMATVFSEVVQLIADLIRGDFSGAWQHWQTIVQTVITTIIEVLTNWVTMAKELLMAFVSIFAELPGWIMETLGVDRLMQLGMDIINGIIDGIKNGAGALKDAMSQMANEALDSAKGALGIFSPSKKMAELVGQHIPAGVGEGVMSGLPQLRDAMAGMTNMITDTAVQGVDGLQGIGASNTQFNQTVSISDARDPEAVNQMVRQSTIDLLRQYSGA